MYRMFVLFCFVLLCFVLFCCVGWLGGGPSKQKLTVESQVVSGSFRTKVFALITQFNASTQCDISQIVARVVSYGTMTTSNYHGAAMTDGLMTDVLEGSEDFGTYRISFR